MDKNQQQVFDKEIVENVAKTISAHFDYPWEFMQKQGRDNIRKLAENILCMLPSSYEENDCRDALLDAAQNRNLEQVAAVMLEAEAIAGCHPSKDARAFANSATIVMKTQKERIAELEALNDELFNKLNFERGQRVELEDDAARYKWLSERGVFGYPSCEGCNNDDVYVVFTGRYEDMYPSFYKAIAAAMGDDNANN